MKEQYRGHTSINESDKAHTKEHIHIFLGVISKIVIRNRTGINIYCHLAHTITLMSPHRSTSSIPDIIACLTLAGLILSWERTSWQAINWWCKLTFRVNVQVNYFIHCRDTAAMVTLNIDALQMLHDAEYDILELLTMWCYGCLFILTTGGCF